MRLAISTSPSRVSRDRSISRRYMRTGSWFFRGRRSEVEFKVLALFALFKFLIEPAEGSLGLQHIDALRADGSEQVVQIFDYTVMRYEFVHLVVVRYPFSLPHRPAFFNVVVLVFKSKKIPQIHQFALWGAYW